jgi:DNA-binding XRE family transcriptional regulator
MIAPDAAMKTKNELDQRVGERLRSRRLKMGLSQTELAAAAGVTFQQVQKYERGANRISAGRMIHRKAWRGPRVFCRRLRRRVEGQRRDHQVGPRH